MPQAVEECVQKRLADAGFKAPEGFEGDRKSFAYALCTSLHKKGQLKAGEASLVSIEGQTYYSLDEKVWLQAAMAFEEPADGDLEKMNRYSAALTPGSIIKFKDAILVRAEVNKNKDKVDEQGIKEIASTLPLKPIDNGHKHEQVVGLFIDAEPIENDTAVSTSGLIFAGRFPDIARDLVAGNGHLSVDARAERAICTQCGGVYHGESEYCAHINRDMGGRAVRKLEGLESDGGAIVPNPAGSNTHIPQQGLVMIAHIKGGNDEVVNLMCAYDEEQYFAGKQLGSQERKDLPDSDFALIQDGRRRFPIHDCAHARNALARLPNAKELSSSERAQVKSKAQAKLNSKECRAQRKQGGANVDELEEVQTKLKATTEALEKSEDEATKLQTEMETLQPQLEAMEKERDSEKETREAAEKKRDELQAEFDKIKLQARLEKVKPFMDEDELKEKEKVIGEMAEDAFNLMLASVAKAGEGTQPKKSGSVFLGQEDGTKTPVVWA